MGYSLVMTIVKRSLNLLFPPQCLCCRALVPTHGTLCLECWQKVQFITEPMCACCGLPLEFAVDAFTLCGECLREHPPFSRARAAFRYDEHSRALILKLKFHDETNLAPTLGRWLKQAGSELLEGSDIIIPVPLHYRRLVRRRYNQAALLAWHLSKLSGLAMCVDGLVRTRPTLPQSGLTRAQRKDNVKSAFAIHPKHGDKIKGKSVLLVDDVMTTGSTLHACTLALQKAGAASVNVLTLARTVR